MNLRKLYLGQILIGLGALCFGIVLIEAVIVGAGSVHDLSFIGKTFTGIFMLILAFAFIRWMLLPFFRWIVDLVDITQPRKK